LNRLKDARGPAGQPARWLWWSLTLSWASFIFVLSSIPEASLPDAGPPGSLLDRLVTNGAHLALYGVLSAFLRRALAERPQVGWYAWAIALAYGLSDEWHQSFVPGREGSFLDLCLDGMGAALGLWVRPWVWGVRWGFWTHKPHEPPP
jgi:VanZ family protein